MKVQFFVLFLTERTVTEIQTLHIKQTSSLCNLHTHTPPHTHPHTHINTHRHTHTQLYIWTWLATASRKLPLWNLHSWRWGRPSAAQSSAYSLICSLQQRTSHRDARPCTAEQSVKMCAAQAGIVCWECCKRQWVCVDERIGHDYKSYLLSLSMSTQYAQCFLTVLPAMTCHWVCSFMSLLSDVCMQAHLFPSTWWPLPAVLQLTTPTWSPLPAVHQTTPTWSPLPAVHQLTTSTWSPLPAVQQLTTSTVDHQLRSTWQPLPAVHQLTSTWQTLPAVHQLTSTWQIMPAVHQLTTSTWSPVHQFTSTWQPLTPVHQLTK